MAREKEGKDPDPSAGFVDARRARGAATVTSPTRLCDPGKKIWCRKTFGAGDTMGLIIGVVAMVASVSTTLMEPVSCIRRGSVVVEG